MPSTDESPTLHYLATLRARSKDVAHDLKTPLNILVLNLELLKVRLRKLDADPKRSEHLSSIDRETRRIGRIVDAFFDLFAIDPDGETSVATLLANQLAEKGVDVPPLPDISIPISEENLTVLADLLGRGIFALFEREGLRIESTSDDTSIRLLFSAEPVEGVEIGKALKFYYTDRAGESSVELASARILIELLGGGLELNDDPSNLQLSLIVPTVRESE